MNAPIDTTMPLNAADAVRQLQDAERWLEVARTLGFHGEHIANVSAALAYLAGFIATNAFGYIVPMKISTIPVYSFSSELRSGLAYLINNQLLRCEEIYNHYNLELFVARKPRDVYRILIKAMGRLSQGHLSDKGIMYS